MTEPKQYRQTLESAIGATPSGTDGSVEPLDIDGDELVRMRYECSNPEHAALRQRLQDTERERDHWNVATAELAIKLTAAQSELQDAQKEILRLKEEVLLLAGLLADEDEGDTLPAKEQS